MNLADADRARWIGLRPIQRQCCPVLRKTNLEPMQKITSLDGSQLAGAKVDCDSFVKLYDIRTFDQDSKRSHFSECAYVYMRCHAGSGAPPSLIPVKSAGIVDNMLAIEMPRCEASCRSLLDRLASVHPRELCQRLIQAQAASRERKPSIDRPEPRGMKRSGSCVSRDELHEMLMEGTPQVASAASGYGSNDAAAMRSQMVPQPSSPTSSMQAELSADDVGEFLKEWIHQGASTPIPEDLLWVLTFDVATALEHLHTKFFLWHNDVKPDNVLIALDRRDSESELRFTLCDFGCAVPVTTDGLCASPEDIGGRGTHWFNGPECSSYCWKPRHSVKSDIWGLGVTLLELAVGQLPSIRIDRDTGDRLPQCSLCLSLPQYGPWDNIPKAEWRETLCACKGKLVVVGGVCYRSHEVFGTVAIADIEGGLALLEKRAESRSPLRLSQEFREFLKALLVHDPNCRPSATEVLARIPKDKKSISRTQAFQAFRCITGARSLDKTGLFPFLECSNANASPTSAEQSKLFWQQCASRANSYENLTDSNLDPSKGEE
jgi:serine/threonine protein kinase